MDGKYKKGQIVYIQYDHEIIECKIISVTQEANFFTGELFPIYDISGIFPLGNRIITDDEYKYLNLFVEDDPDICFLNGRFASKRRRQWEDQIFPSRQEAEKHFNKHQIKMD